VKEKKLSNQKLAEEISQLCDMTRITIVHFVSTIFSDCVTRSFHQKL